MNCRKLVMLGAAPETRGSIAATVRAYREHGLFKRWPVEYIATHAEGSPVDNARIYGRALRSLMRLIVHEGRLAVHAHLSARTGLLREATLLALAAAARRPLVLQLHGGGFQAFHDSAATPTRATMRQFLERAAAVIAPCEATRGWVRSVTREANVICVPPVVATAQKIERGEKQNLVLFLARLEAQKGVFDLVEAVAALRARVPDIRLVCAGEGDRDAVARFAARIGIGDAVKFVGWVGPSGKRALLEEAAVFALPSYAEGLPTGLVEAMAAGVPVVASPVGGIPEVIADGASGFLAAPGDKAALTRLIGRLLTDRALAARIGNAARETARARFSAERGIARVEEIYAALGLRSLIEPQRSGTPQAGLRQAA